MTESSSRIEEPASLAYGGEVHQLQRSLHGRLEDGYARIEEAKLNGNDISEWETFWIKLLREYEGVCRELDRAA